MNIKLPNSLINKLLKLPESGMGYHKVNLILKDKTILKDIIVLNSSIAVVDAKIKKSHIIDIQ